MKRGSPDSQFPPRQCSSCLGKWSLSVTCWEGSLQYARVLTAWSVQKHRIIKHPCLEIIGRTDTQLEDARQTGTQDTIVSTFRVQDSGNVPKTRLPANKCQRHAKSSPDMLGPALIGRLTQELQNQGRRSIKNCTVLSPSPRRELPSWSTCRVAGFTPLKDSKPNKSCTLHKHKRNPGLPRTLTIQQLVASPVLAGLVGLP